MAVLKSYFWAMIPRETNAQLGDDQLGSQSYGRKISHIQLGVLRLSHRPRDLILAQRDMSRVFLVPPMAMTARARTR